jgi:hypothetical protein
VKVGDLVTHRWSSKRMGVIIEMGWRSAYKIAWFDGHSTWINKNRIIAVKKL